MDRAMKVATVIGVWLVAVLLLLNFLTALFDPRSASAQREDGLPIGRFQIAAWAADSGIVLHHHGYIIIDTVTGRVVENVEIYTPGSGTGTNIP